MCKAYAKPSGLNFHNRFPVMLPCLLLCWQPLIGLAASMTEVYTGAEFVNALTGPNETEIVLMNDIVLRARDFLPDTIVTIDKNVTIKAGNETIRGSSDAILDFNYMKHKVRLRATASLTMQHIVLVRFREGSVTASPGSDLLAPAYALPGALPSRLILVNCVVVLRWCYPPEVQTQNIKAFERPKYLPGTQNVTLRIPQMGCINDSSAPPRQRCWPSAGYYNDMGLAGADLDVRYVPIPNNYMLWLVNTMYVCSGILPIACISSLGPIGCLYKSLAEENQAPPPAAAEPSSSERSVLGPALGATLGGTALAVILAGTVVLLLPYRRRKRRAAETGAAANEAAYAVGVMLGPSGEERGGEREVRKSHPGGGGRGGGAGQDPYDTTDDDTVGRMAGVGLQCDAGLRSDLFPDLYVVVTPLTPLRRDLVLGVECGGEVVLLPVLRGKGSFGRVVEGMYGGQRVAVKLLPCDVLLPHPRSSEVDDGNGEVKIVAGAGGEGAEGVAAEGGDVGGAAAAGADVADAAADRAGGADMDCCVSPPADGTPTQLGAVLCTQLPQGEGAKEMQQEQQREPQEQYHEGLGKPPTAGRKCERGARELRSFAQEVEVLGRCEHPNVVRLLAACLGPPQPCLVMELMETSLDKLLHGKDPALLPLSTVLAVARDIARGLEYLHPTIVHRDLKPGNVLVNTSGPVPVAKLSDFGLSRMRNTVMPTKHPEAGTPAYMAPECFDTANLKITHQADVYSFAVILWEMLTGRLPWQGCTPLEVAYAVTLLGERLPLRSIPEERCPAALSRLLRQCFDAEPRRRPAAAEVVKELELIAEAAASDPASHCAPEHVQAPGDIAAAAKVASPPDIPPLSPGSDAGSDALFTNPERTLSPASLDRMLVGSSVHATPTASTRDAQ